MSNEELHFLDLEPQDAIGALGTWLGARREPSYRRQQILEALHVHRTAAPSRMASLPLSLRAALEEGPMRPVLSTDSIQVSQDGTRKYRFLLQDGVAIESVWIPAGDRGTLCVSSQAGCPAACTFCATGAGGFQRNLRPAEIIAQWLRVLGDVGQQGETVTQIVFMGMGEPLYNYPALATALRRLTAAESFAFSPRRITVSTVGVVPKIRALSREFPQVRLAVSLHSALPRTRDQIVPVNRRYPLDELRRTLRDIAPRSRRVSLEYVLLAGVNDSAEESEALALFARETAGHINLLPFHPFPGAPYPPTPPTLLEDFRRRVEVIYDGRVTIRRSRGLDIAGACGQLALAPRQRAPRVSPPKI